MKKLKVFSVLFIAAALVLSACGSSGSSEGSGSSSSGGSSSSESTDSTASDKLILGIESDVVTLDPNRCYETYASLIVRALYDTLYDFSADSDEPQPNIATGVEFSDDGLTATITLRDDVVFASGNPMTAKDVQFSIMRCKNLKDNPSFICDGIDSVDVIDDYTVQFNLNAPDSSFTAKLTYSALAIIDSESAIAQGATADDDAATTDTAKSFFDAGNSLGSGPYTMESWTIDEEFVLARNDNFYDGEAPFSQIVLREMGDSNTQMMSLTQGDIQIALGLNQDTAEELAGVDGVTVESYPTMTMGFLYMNMDESLGGPVSDPVVQQAIRLAIDYEGIQTLVGEGSLTPVSYIQVGLQGALPALDVSTATDVEAAKALLAEAGYPDGFEIDLPCCTLAPEGIPLTDIAQKVASDLSAVGITVNIDTQDWAGGYADDYRNGTLGFSIMYWSPDYIDPNGQLEFLPGGIVALRAGWTADMNPEIAAYKEAISTETDQTVRTGLIEEVQELTASYTPIVPLVQYPKFIGSDAGLKGTDFIDLYRIDLRAVTY